MVASTFAVLLSAMLTLHAVTRESIRVNAMTPEAYRVSALVGGTVELPCDTRPPSQTDALQLVVWYRDDTPIYSYDGRVSGPAAHWKEDELEGRARWHAPAPSALHLSRVTAADAADYRCRVDFLVSPTRNYKIALDVIEPPDKPAIFDEYGKEIASGAAAGPYTEGGYFQLTCVTKGGKPTPRLRWWRDERVLAEAAPPAHPAPATPHAVGAATASLHLRVHNLTRADLGALYTCSADNSPHAPPQRNTIEIDLYLRPLTVEILAREHPLSAGRESLLTCRSTGARPPAALSWWLDDRRLTSVDKQQESAGGNETLSVLRWTPELEHDGRRLTCRAAPAASTVAASASAPAAPGAAPTAGRIETTQLLNVQYVPIVRLQLGSKMNPNDIEEGDDVYFECTVQANPQEYKVVWEHNGMVVLHNESAGVFVNARSLVLQKVTRRQAGRYRCSAFNVEGDGCSQPVNLLIMYAPVCRTSGVVVVGVALQEAARVLCEVDAHPPPESFQWSLNNSAGAFQVDAARYTVDKAARRSTLTYAPAVDADYGSLACRATNLAGQQRTPCRYTLRPAARPEPPRLCAAANLTDDSLQLRCEPGYDGGLPATYVAEAWAGGVLLRNASGAAPTWVLRELGAARDIRLVMYAANARGRSEHVALAATTLPAQSPRTEAQGGGEWDVGWAVGGVAGAAVTLLLVTCVAVLVVRLRQHRARDYDVSSAPGAATHKAAPPSTRSSLLPADDKNPDVVPLDRGVMSPPDPPPYSAAVRVPLPPPATSPAAPPGAAAHISHRSYTPLSPQPPQCDVESGDWRLPGGGGSGAGAVGTEWRGTAGAAVGVARGRREVVTTRTPLLAAAHQESCV